MGKGYMGKVLVVELDSGRMETREIPEEDYEKFLSGTGMAARILFDEIPKAADPLGPENALALMTGLLTATPAVMAGRWMAAGKSPLTGGWGDANGGGYFSAGIKRAGFDGLIVKGAAERPVYLKVIDGKAELCDASSLWGLDTVETEARLREELGTKNLEVACVGPAAEKLSLISGIVNQGARIAARSGLGAVMAAKKLKAVAVSGRMTPEVHDPEAMKRLARKFSRWVKEGDRAGRFMKSRVMRAAARFMRISPYGFAATGDMMRSVLRTYGTIVTNIISAETGDSPVKNWKGAGVVDFPMSTHSSRLDPARIVSFQKRRYHCYSCPIGCGGVLDLSGKTRFGLSETHKPEYETCSAFGSLILNNDLETVFLINDLLNRAGMDTISAGAAVAFAMECYEQGLLSREDADGLELTWGNSEAVVSLVKKMVAREGIGDLLADGVRKAAARLGKGAEEFAMHAGGQELPMHDQRLDPGFGVAYSMEPTPARHTNYSYLYLELFGLHRIFPGLPAAEMVYKKSSRLATEGREVLLSAASKFMQVVNGAGVCLFAVQCGPAYPLLAFLEAATGWGKSPEEYLEIGERIQHLRQAFNLKQGVVPGRDFRLPGRTIGEPPLEAGPLKGVRIPIEELNRNFARAMGWDELGRPRPERMRELGLSEAAEEIERSAGGSG